MPTTEKSHHATEPFECHLCGWRADTTPPICGQCGCATTEEEPDDASEDSEAVVEDCDLETSTDEMDDDGMPESLLEAIRDQAFLNYPIDDEAREEAIEEQKEAFEKYEALIANSPKRLPDNIRQDIMASLERSHPFDFSERVHHWTRQVEGYLKWQHLTGAYRPKQVPAAVIESIAAESVRDSPGDYEWQGNNAASLIESYLLLSKTEKTACEQGVDVNVIRFIRARAERHEPFDFTKQHSEVEEQVNAVIKIQAIFELAATHGTSSDEVRRLHLSAEEKHSGDYPAQLVFLIEQLDSITEVS